MKMNELKTKIEEAGIVGAGGAGFPTHVKLSDKVDKIIINAAECEPLLTADFFILKQAFSKVLNGIIEVLDAVGEQATAVLALKEHNASKLGLTDCQRLNDRVEVKILPNVYPMGDEVVLVYEATGRVVTPGSIPLTVGVMVLNAETVYNIAEAIEGKCVTHTFLTIAGIGFEQTTVKAPVGALAADVINNYVAEGKEVDFSEIMLLDGGPMMGRVVDPETHRITKTTKGLLLLPKDGRVAMLKNGQPEQMVKRAGSVCCQCRMCTDLCPRHLLGYKLEPHKIMRSVSYGLAYEKDVLLNASVCSQCGLCEAIACCQNLSPKKVCGEIKAQLGKNGIKYDGSDQTPNPDKFREYRQVASNRLVQRLGVKQYESDEPIFADEILTPQNVEIPLKQHVGAPSVACVNIGDKVELGTLIAKQPEGALGARIHSSMAGVVTQITGSSIRIEEA